jgi:hypothetical protein
MECATGRHRLTSICYVPLTSIRARCDSVVVHTGETPPP